MLCNPNHHIIPNNAHNMTLFALLLLIMMNAIKLVDTIWINVLTNPLPINTLMIFTLSLLMILFAIYRMFSTALNPNPIRMQKKMRLLSLGSLFARWRLFPAEYFRYSSAYADMR